MFQQDEWMRIAARRSHSSFLWDRDEPRGRGMSVSNQRAPSHMLQLVRLSLCEGDWVSQSAKASVVISSVDQDQEEKRRRAPEGGTEQQAVG
ncbi:hypothetical protein EYF80_007610 [Liparis tanakae]|uniref:Uncharacterized protein n=1 Tax=Liparis tanakae TaxID=230148 RepID=A0A4Z2IY64_9TELE|nr:hypothetical protein EYF80_007610 [Liparis tanakae]